MLKLQMFFLANIVFADWCLLTVVSYRYNLKYDKAIDQSKLHVIWSSSTSLRLRCFIGDVLVIGWLHGLWTSTGFRGLTHQSPTNIFCFNFLLLNHLDAVQDEMDMSPVEIDALMIEEDVSDDEDDDHEEVVCQTIYFPLCLIYCPSTFFTISVMFH